MSQTYEFSPERHATFLDGYMDAVGRAFTNDAFLQTDGCDRLTYYLIEYIEWFEAFHAGAKASRLHCSPLPQEEIDGHRYLIEIDAAHAVLLIFWKKAKAG